MTKLINDEKENNINNENILIVKNLTKKYNNFIAVDDISFSVKKGSLFAFLGVNGAGKSTTINIISGIIKKDSGEILFNNLDFDNNNDDIKRNIGIVFQSSVLDNVLSAKENLTLRAAYYGIKGDEWKKREKTIVEMLELEPFYNKPLNKLSGGQKRRVDIARAIVHSPKFLILDEPTTGLDPQTRISVWNLINYLREKTKMTVFLTTHYMEEAEKSSYVVIINKGKIIAEGTPNELKNIYSGDYLLIYSKKDQELEDILKLENKEYKYKKDNSNYKIKFKNSEEIKQFISKNIAKVKDFEVIKGNMDDVFLNVTGNFNNEEENNEK